MVATPFPCDFHKWDEEPLKLQLNDDKLMACGTTLGADNGIGVACALALLENRDQFKHGPIEVSSSVCSGSSSPGSRHF